MLDTNLTFSVSDPEAVVNHENRCACVDYYYMTGGIACNAPAIEGSVFCALCWDAGCDCRCPQCRTSLCSGDANGCRCPACKAPKFCGCERLPA